MKIDGSIDKEHRKRDKWQGKAELVEIFRPRGRKCKQSGREKPEAIRFTFGWRDRPANRREIILFGAVSTVPPTVLPHNSRM